MRDNIEKLQISFNVVELLGTDSVKKEYEKKLEKLQYLRNLSEVDIQKCYQNCFLKDIFYKFDDFPRESFRMLVNLKFTALSTFMH